MPKRSAEEKLVHYERKIRKIQEQVKKKKRQVKPLPDLSDSEENSYVEPSENIMDKPPEQPVEIWEGQMDEIQSALPLPPAPSPPTPSPGPVRDPVEPKDIQTTPTPSTEDLSEPPLDSELLSALGACTSDTPDFGDNIHNNLANLWSPLLRKGLPKEDKERLTKEYLTPSNCKLLQAPKLNAEISAAVSEIVRGRDKKLINFQQQLGTGVSAINRGMDMLLKTDNKTLTLKHLSDGCRLLLDLHYCFTKDRTKLITPSLEKSILHAIQDIERDDTLFGNSLAEKIKACKAIERQGSQLRNKTNPKIATPQALASRPVQQQGNWNAPPRYTPNRGGRGGRGRAASSAPRRHYTTTTLQSTSKNSNQPKTRSNAQQ